MKRKDLYNYIREEIINELSEIDTDKTRGTVVMPKTTNPADVKKMTDSGVDVELKEMARKATGLKPGKNIDDIKSIYVSSIASKVLDLVKDAGEDGITIGEIAQALGIKSVPQINPLIRELIAIGAISKGESAMDEPESTPEPEVTIAKDEKEEEEIEMEMEPEEDEEEELDSDDEETDKEEEAASKEFEKEPSSADLAAAEKTLGVAPGKETEINTIVSKIKTISDKIEKLSGAEREAKLKALKQYVNNNKALLRGIDIDIVTNGLIS
jgi:hypothetical protein